MNEKITFFTVFLLVLFTDKGFRSTIFKESKGIKTIVDKLMYIPNDNTLKLVVKTFEHSTK